jgi:hypothetical protein
MLARGHSWEGDYLKAIHVNSELLAQFAEAESGEDASVLEAIRAHVIIDQAGYVAVMGDPHLGLQMLDADLPHKNWAARQRDAIQELISVAE